MKRILSILILFLPALLVGQTLKKLTVQEQTEDINYIQSELVKLHPGIYTYQSESEFREGFDFLKKSLIEDQTVFEFYQKLVPVINNIGCGHTTVKFPSNDLRKLQKSRKLLPIEVQIIDDKIYITKMLVKNSDVESGNEIISINDIPSSQLLNENLMLYPSDGRILSRKYQMMGKYFSINFSKFHIVEEEFELEVKSNSTIQKTQLQGITYDDYLNKTLKPNEKDLEFEIIDSLAAALITIRNSSTRKKFSEFLESSFHQIQNTGIQNLIIDLRYDSFNRDHDGAELYSYITDTVFSYYRKLEVTEYYDVPKALKWITHYPIEQDSTGHHYWTIHADLNEQYPKPSPFQGNVFVLTDGFTFSATTEFSSIVKSNERGLIVGIETGGGYYGNNSGGMLIRQLPNSKLKVVVPPMKYIMAVRDLGNYSRGVIPDIPVHININEVISGKDQILNTAINLITLSQ